MPGHPPVRHHMQLSACLLPRTIVPLTRAALSMRSLSPVTRDNACRIPGDACSRIFKTLHVLSYVDQAPYRAQIKGMRNLREGRHDLARHVFHGRRGDLRRAYHEGMEDQLGALGLVLNCITLWKTVYLDAALAQLRTDGCPVRDEDVVRLSPYMRRHLNVHGTTRSNCPTSPVPAARCGTLRLARTTKAPDRAAAATDAELLTSRLAVPDVRAP